MRILFVLFFVQLGFLALSQNGRVEKDDRTARLIDRYEIKYGHFPGHTSSYPVYKDEVYQYFKVLDSVGLGPKELNDRDIVLGQYQEFSPYEPKEPVPFFKNFYRNKYHFFEYQNKNVYFSLDPILFLQAGIENTDTYQLRNTRAVEIAGRLGRRIYFRSKIFENQSTFLSYHENTINRFNAIPGNALLKPFSFKLNSSAYDFLNAEGHAGLNLNQFMNLEIGHGRHFIGNGIRSLILSNYATNYFYTRANTRFWKFRYQNLFTELTPFSPYSINGGDELLPKKFIAQHTLSFKANHRLEIALVETVIFNRESQFELQYLNPIIFYRAVEQFLNSADNILIGGQVKWNIVDGYQLYGQLMLDEFNLTSLIDDANWWGNKYGLQLGAKAIDFLGVSHLDIQGEFNMVRPYTYSHSSFFDEVFLSAANYSHFNQSLAHPLGANFVEAILDIRYQATNKLSFHPRIILSAQGVDNVTSPDSTGYNIGANILLPNIKRAGSENQRLLQGDRVNVQLYALNTYYEFRKNYFADLNIQYRTSTSPQAEFNQNSLYIGLGIRTNFTELYRDY